MVADENVVFLKTKKIYTLHANDNLYIDVTDDTEVVNNIKD
jgi:hypothetical protein